MPTPGDAPVTRAVARGELKAEIEAVEKCLLDHMDGMEISLLREFEGTARRFEARMGANEMSVLSAFHRLSAAEERISELERRVSK